MTTAEQNEWITRVLGAAIPPGGGALATAIASWRAASDAVDDQISQLQQALRRSDDEELVEIAEYGLNAVTGNYRVPLMATIRSVESGDTKEAAKLSRIAAAFRKHLESDAKVAACDDNPVGVSVSIRATLVPALDALERSLP